jgi:hypothetical protein
MALRNSSLENGLAPLRCVIEENLAQIFFTSASTWTPGAEGDGCLDPYSAVTILQNFYSRRRAALK